MSEKVENEVSTQETEKDDSTQETEKNDSTQTDKNNTSSSVSGNNTFNTVFDGLIQNAKGSWSSSDKVKPLIVSVDTISTINGLIQNAKGSWNSSDNIKPLIVSITEGSSKDTPLIVSITEEWPPSKEKLITEVAAKIYASNDCPVGQEYVKAWRAVNMAEQLYSVLCNRKYVK